MQTDSDIFLSVVIVAHDQRGRLEDVLRTASEIAQRNARDHEIVVVDNGSRDDSVDRLRSLACEQGIPNLQVYVLSKRVENDIAAWAGVDNALGDYVAVIDAAVDDVRALPELLEEARRGADIVFASNRREPPVPFTYSLASGLFGAAVKRLLGIDSVREMPFYRVLSRKVVNYMLRHNAAGLAYRWLPAASGLRKTTVVYDSPLQRPPRRLLADLDRGARLLVSSTHAPMRLVTLLSLFGALANLVYSGYVIAIAVFKEDVEPGWVTLSLQQSGMFFLFSLVLLVLGEYVLHMARLAANAPSYHVAEEFTSAVLTRRERLNVEVGETARVGLDAGPSASPDGR